MNLTSAVAEVMSITKRPDKQAEIVLNINKAITFFTLKTDFFRDFLEDEIAIDPQAYGDSIDLSAAFPTFRKIKYLKPRGKRYYLHEADPTHIFVPGGVLQPNKFYLTGLNLTYTLSELSSFLDIGYYTFPDALVLTAAENHWMLDVVPWMIIERAASQIFKSIGDDVSSRFYENSSNEMFVVARNDFGTGVVAAAE